MARCLVDCTGDANLVSLAGGELLDDGPDKQPGTYVCRATGYDAASLDMETINGDLMVTADDYTSWRVWPDALCHSFYPIDLHTADGGYPRTTQAA